MKLKKLLPVLVFVMISTCVYAADNNAPVKVEEFLNELANVLHDKHQGDYSETSDVRVYLAELGVFDNIPDLVDNENITCHEAEALVINSISVDKDMIMKAGNYPNGYRTAFRTLFITSQERSELSGEAALTQEYADTLLGYVKRYVCDKTWVTAYEAAKEAGFVNADVFDGRDFNEPITRAETAVLISGVIAADVAELTENTLQFADVDDSYWAADLIVKLRQLGIFNGYEDGLFRPDDAISLIELWKTCICAAELDEYGSGEYPDRYTGLITYFDLWGGLGNKSELFLDMNSSATYGQALQIIYNIWLDADNIMLNALD